MVTVPVKPCAVQEDYTLWVTVLAAGSTIVSWGTGTLIFFLISPYAGALYLLLCAAVIVLSTNLRCRYCVYYGKRCANGFGLIAARLCSKGDPAGFCDMKNIMPVAIPSFAVLLLPLAAGIVWSLLDFSWTMAGLTAFYFVAAMGGGFVLQSNVYCKRCAQGKIGCPSYRMMQGGRLE